MPFVIGLLVIGLKAGRWYRPVMVLVLIACCSLWYLKGTPSKVFKPMIGAEVTLASDVCLSEPPAMYPYPFISAAYPIDSDMCQYLTENGQVSGPWKGGMKLTVVDVRVSHPDFSEQYDIVLESVEGVIVVNARYLGQTIRNSEGHRVRESDLWRGLFYYPAMLMYYALLPLILMSFL